MFKLGYLRKWINISHVANSVGLDRRNLRNAVVGKKSLTTNQAEKLIPFLQDLIGKLELAVKELERIKE